MGILTETEQLFKIGIGIHYEIYGPSIHGLSHGSRRLLNCVLMLTKDEEGYQKRVNSLVDREIKISEVLVSYHRRRSQITTGRIPVLNRICNLVSSSIGEIVFKKAIYSYFRETDALINEIFPPQRTPRLVSPSEVPVTST